MDTVSYLTINDETKEIADKASRDNINNIIATVTAHDKDIEYIQLETGPQGSILASIDDAQALAVSAQVSAATANASAVYADEKATEAQQAAETAQSHADSALTAASSAWDRAGEAATAAAEAQTQAFAAEQSANVAQSSAENAISSATTAQNKADEASIAAATADAKADAATRSAASAQRDAIYANQYANGALAGMSTLQSVIDTAQWFADHKVLTEDTTVDPKKNYYTLDETTGTMSKAELNGSENPQELGLYELDETIQNYVASRIAETPDGLYISSNQKNG